MFSCSHVFLLFGAIKFAYFNSSIDFLSITVTNHCVIGCFLKEKIGYHRITAVVLALLGVALIMRPGTSFFKLEMLLALGSAVSYAIFQVVTRRLKGMGDLPGLITIQHLCYLVSALPLLAYNLTGNWEQSGNQSVDFLLRQTVWPTFIEYVFSLCVLSQCYFSLLHHPMHIETLRHLLLRRLSMWQYQLAFCGVFSYGMNGQIRFPGLECFLFFLVESIPSIESVNFRSRWRLVYRCLRLLV